AMMKTLNGEKKATITSIVSAMTSIDLRFWYAKPPGDVNTDAKKPASIVMIITHPAATIFPLRLRVARVVILIMMEINTDITCFGLPCRNPWKKGKSVNKLKKRTVMLANLPRRVASRSANVGFSGKCGAVKRNHHSPQLLFCISISLLFSFDLFFWERDHKQEGDSLVDVEFMFLPFKTYFTHQMTTVFTVPEQ